MCETMANIPVEDKSSYVLTEDMIDAAMNEQFAYQEDLESEGESSSIEESIETYQDTHENYISETINSVENSSLTIDVPGPNINVNTESAENIPPPRSPVSNKSKVSVLVIETGLENRSDYIANEKEVSSSKEQQSTNTPNGSFNNVTDDVGGDLVKTAQGGIEMQNRDSKTDFTTLKSLLSANQEKDDIIDLCDSDVDGFDEEDDQEAESIDDELKSVMETNLMAEIGMDVSKKPASEPSPDKPNFEKAPVNVAPRISVKNIAQISSPAFNRLPQNSTAKNVFYVNNYSMKSKMNENHPLRNPNYPVRNPNINPNVPIKESNQSPTPIHINKIAVPHSTFVNSHGQKMKCVYVKSTSNLPFVINTPTQTTASNANTKYVLSQPMKKGTVKMPAIAALKNLTKNLQPQQLVFQKKNKVLTVAQKLQKSLPVQNVLPPMPQTVNGSVSWETVQSLILTDRAPYVPPKTFPEDPLHTCHHCNDKFICRSSLCNHLERRTVSIRYWCQMCKSYLQFFNKCTLLIHLAGHNYSLKQTDVSFISISPIPNEMLEKGVMTTFLKEYDPIQGQPLKSASSNGNIKLNQTNITNTPKSKAADSRSKTMSVVSLSNMSNHKITTVAGQSKSVCYQTQSSNEGSKPVMSTVANSQASKKNLPLLLPKTSNQVQAPPLATKSFKNQAIEQPTSKRKSPPNNVILLCSKFPQPPNIQQNPVVNPIPPNVVCESDSSLNGSLTVTNNGDTDMIVDHDDDVTVVPNNTEEEIVNVENIEENVTSKSSQIVLNSESKTKNPLNKRKKDPVSTSTLGPKKRNCSECKTYSPNISKHLNGTNRPHSLNLACKICNLILPTKCALNIHHRIHMKIPPHKCPDCGKDFISWDDLHAHLKYSCGHFAKCVRYICGGCKAHFPAQNGLAQHIVKNHSKDIFKCRACPVAFYKKASFIKHILDDHPDVDNKSELGMDYKQCQMCPKKLLPEENFLSHAQEHSSSMIYGYKCSMCNIVYANKMAFIIHQIKEKTNREDQSGKSGDHNRPTHRKESVEEAVQLSDSDSDFDDEPEIVRKYPENNSDSIVTEKDPLSLEDWECTQEQIVKEKTEQLCIVCKKNSVVLLPEIDLNSQSLCCKQCVKPIDDDSSTVPCRNSIESRNSFTQSKSNKQRRSNPKNIYRSSSTDEVQIIKKRRISDVSHNSSPENERSLDPLMDSPSRKRSRKKAKEKFNPKGQTHIQGQVIKSRSLDELCHKCSKCEYVTDKRELFLKHITVHRTDPNTYQCLECGLCFVVLPSLERHLQMHHGVKDVNNYTENNKASLPQRVVQEIQDNQCHVCYDLFDSKSSLEKHRLIHGMAFVRRLSKSP